MSQKQTLVCTTGFIKAHRSTQWSWSISESWKETLETLCLLMLQGRERQTEVAWRLHMHEQSEQLVPNLSCYPSCLGVTSSQQTSRVISFSMTGAQRSHAGLRGRVCLQLWDYGSQFQQGRYAQGSGSCSLTLHLWAPAAFPQVSI